jgi:hypothetical protein
MPKQICGGLPNFPAPGRGRSSDEAGLGRLPEQSLNDLALKFLVGGRRLEDLSGEAEDVGEAVEAEVVEVTQRRSQELHHLGLECESKCFESAENACRRQNGEVLGSSPAEGFFPLVLFSSSKYVSTRT